MRSLLASCARQLLRTLSARPMSSLHYEDHNRYTDPDAGTPIVIAHGMLGSSANWTSLSKALHKRTQRRVVAFDAVNHGQSPHCKDLVTYQSMSDDAVALVQQDLGMDKASFIGHSMGGRTMMWMALNKPELVDRLIVVDISPVNTIVEEKKEKEEEEPPKQYPSFFGALSQGVADDIEAELRKEHQRLEQKYYGNMPEEVMDASEWDMSHFFHAMLDVEFPDGATLSQARREADKQLAVRIQDPNLRAWLLMNVAVVDEESGRVGWRNNVQGIYDSFKQSIAKFPNAAGLTCNSPTLFIGGADSDYLPVTDHPEIHDYFPYAYFKYIPGAGHWVHSQKPREFLEMTVQFLETEDL